MHADYLRRVAAICLLVLSYLFTAPAPAEDWREQWSKVLPGVAVPVDAIEAEEVFWTYYVERNIGARICLDVVQVLNTTFERLVSTGSTTSELGDMVKAALYHCVEMATGSGPREELLHVLAQAGLDEISALMRKSERGESTSFSLEELQRLGRRIERRTAHLARWKRE